jgi:hypothetical protein
MNANRFFAITLIITLLVFVFPAAIVVIADPFFIFHKKFSRNIGFDGTDRYQNAGLINTFLADPAERFDTINLVTSMSQNFPVSAFKNDFGKNALKLTLSGGRARDIETIARKAIATGRVKRVVWEVFTSFADENPDAINRKAPLPLFLYNDTLADNWRYVFNNDVFEKAFKLARAQVLTWKKVERSSLAELYTWRNNEQFIKFNEPANIEKLRRKLRTVDLPIGPSPPHTIRTEFPNLQKNLFPVLKANPDIEFLIFFPPISHYAYAEYGNEKFWLQMLMRKNVLEEARNLKNVRVFAFDLNDSASGALQNFLDPEHYRPWVNATMAESMLKPDHILTADEWKSYTDALISKVNAFAQNFLASAP